VFTGNPVRRAILERAGAAYIPPGDYPMSLVVIGGSQGARILAQVVPRAVALLPEALRGRVRVAQQARDDDAQEAATIYANAGVSAEVEPFFHDIPSRFSEAQLVIARSGASTVADLSVIGRPSMMPESLFTPEALAEQITNILTNESAANQMAMAALSAGKPDATEALVALTEELNEKNRT